MAFITSPVPSPSPSPPRLEGASLNRGDWSLHRKGAIDQARHKQKVKDALRENLADVVSEQSIITSDGKRIVKVPIRTLDEFRFRFDPGDEENVGTGDGNSQVGDVLEHYGRGQGSGRGPGAGDEPGIDYYEAEVTIDDLAALVFEDLGLPNLEPKRQRELVSPDLRFTDVRRSGPLGNLDKRRTVRENIKRNALRGRPHFGGLTSDDLRFKTWEQSVQPEASAAVLAMMDVSGSMGTFEKYISRAFYFWMVSFLRSKYDRVEIVFIAHHTEAKEVTEAEFFSRGESGGTRASSAYELALAVIANRFPPTDWNIYPFHFSDGDNWPSDTDLCQRLVADLLHVSSLFGYGEIRHSRFSYQSTMMQAFATLNDPRFLQVTITDKAEVYPALRTFFGPRENP